MSRINYGQVEVDLGGEVYTLKPTPGAILSINSRFGGLRNAAERVYALDVGAVADIITDGAGVGRKHREAIAEQVAAAGVANVAGPVAEYIGLIMNPSGREPDDEGDAGKG